MGSISSSFL
ncbi:hypothetical protein OIU76_011380, partial [Salix suchowensis]